MVVAATMGLARLQQPWTLLIAFYRQVSAVRVKFELLRSAVPPDESKVANPAPSA